MNPLITSNPSIRFGKPCIAGTRISVDDIKDAIVFGMSQESILTAFPQLKPEHIQAAIDYQGPTLHALFSEQAANQFGSSIYSTPDGKEVEVTNVYPSEGAEPMYGWADKVHVGEVKEWLRKGRLGTFPCFLPSPRQQEAAVMARTPADGHIVGKKLIGRCKDCKHWLLGGANPLPHEYHSYQRQWKCSNENFIYSWMPKDAPSNGLLFGEGGDGSAFFMVGPEFGCIHWEAKE